MKSRRPLLALLAGAALLLLLSVTFLSTSPPPAESEIPAAASRELDEAAEEVRAVATGMRRLEEKISDQAAQIRGLNESFTEMHHRVEQLAQHRQEREEAETETPALAPQDLPAQGAQEFDLDTLTQDFPAAAASGPGGDLSGRSLTWVESVNSDGALRRGLETVSTDLVGQAGVDEPPRFYIPPGHPVRAVPDRPGGAASRAAAPCRTRGRSWRSARPTT